MKEVFRNLGITLLELLYFPKLSKRVLDDMISFGYYKLVDDLLAKGKGLFLISGHISNWEIMAYSYGKIFRKKLNIVAKSQSNKRVNKKVNEFRELGGNRIIEIGGSLREIFEIVKKNGIVCFLMDQSAHPDYSVYADFFGYKVATFSGPAKMALKMNPEIVFAFPERDKNYNYFYHVQALDYSDLQGGATDENVLILTERINKLLENAIRKNPGQWLWVHRRFKHIQK